MNPNSLETALMQLHEHSVEPPLELRSRLNATIPIRRKDKRRMLTRLTLVATACCAVGLYLLRPSLAQPIAYTRTIQKMQQLPYFHVLHRQRTQSSDGLGGWLTRDTWVDRERGLRIGPLSGTALPEEHLLLPDDTDYWKNGNQVLVLKGKGAWERTYQEQLRSVQDFPQDVLSRQAGPAQAVEGQWQGQKAFLYSLRLSEGPYRRILLFVNPQTGLLIAQQRLVWQNQKEVVKEEFLYEYSQRPPKEYFDAVRFQQRN